MDAIQKLYYALGELAYVMAKADGKIQNEEKEKLHDLVIGSTSEHSIDFDYSEIIFQVLEKENMDSKTTYEMAMDKFKKLSYFFKDDEGMKERFLNTLQQIADAYPEESPDEEAWMVRIRKDFDAL